jgi:hypothetical protein
MLEVAVEVTRPSVEWRAAEGLVTSTATLGKSSQINLLLPVIAQDPREHIRVHIPSSEDDANALAGVRVAVA